MQGFEDQSSLVLCAFVQVCVLFYAGMHMVVVRGLKMNLPPVIGDIDPIRKSKERLSMTF